MTMGSEPVMNWTEIDALLKNKRQLEAIKKYREATYANLHDALSAVRMRMTVLGLRKEIDVKIDEDNSKIVLEGPQGFRVIKISELYDLLG